MRSCILWIAIIAIVLLLAGCGATDKTTAPSGDLNPFAEAKVGTDSTLEVVTWNVQQFPKNGRATVDFLVEAIEALDADIVALQEITSVLDFRQVDAALPGYDGFRAGSAGYDINLAYLYKNSGPLTVDSIYEILIDDDALPRHPLVMQGSFDGKPFVTINNHYKCCGDNHLELNNDWDEETRRYNASLDLQAYIQQHFAGQRVIMVGDFNDELTDPAENNVFENFLDDPQEYRFADLAIAEGPSSGWSYPSWPSHLDHILVTGPLFTALERPDSEVRVIRLFDYLVSGWAEYDKNLSDHLPVFIRIKP